MVTMGTVTLTVTDTLAERFWAKVEKRDGHWWWTGATNPKGYGMFGLGTRKDGTALAHRVARYLEYGTWPVGILRHDCDTPPCVWTAHLIDGTNAENTQDMLQRGRGVPPAVHWGEDANSAKLKEPQVLEIKALLLGRLLTHREIAERYGVSRSLVGLINSGKSWGWLQIPA
jgi:hypothetical protein